MPDPILHNSFGRQVMEKLPDHIRDGLDVSVFEIALNGPDDWEMYRFWIPLLKHGINERHMIMHTQKTGEFLTELLKQVKESDNPKLMFSYWAGFICHYELDTHLHPYICSVAGIFDKDDPTTCCYRGNHMALEHELDKRELEKIGVRLSSRPVSSIFSGKSLPPEMKDDIDAVYKRVYGWDDAWNGLNKAHKDITGFMKIIEDPHGILYRFCNIFLKDKPQFTALSYFKTRYDKCDVENNKHQNWEKGYRSNSIINLSVDDLVYEALKEAVHIITMGYQFLNGGCEEKTISYFIGNKLYIATKSG